MNEPQAPPFIEVYGPEWNRRVIGLNFVREIVQIANWDDPLNFEFHVIWHDGKILGPCRLYGSKDNRPKDIIQLQHVIDAFFQRITTGRIE